MSFSTLKSMLKNWIVHFVAPCHFTLHPKAIRLKGRLFKDGKSPWEVFSMASHSGVKRALIQRKINLKASRRKDEVKCIFSYMTCIVSSSLLLRNHNQAYLKRCFLQNLSNYGTKIAYFKFLKFLGIMIKIWATIFKIILDKWFNPFHGSSNFILSPNTKASKGRLFFSKVGRAMA
jgi:hypothetical protein